ncbi:MAG: hypothetical protein IJY28_03075 [Clostridia bacterium]|nr:hypothetical protein [Clostridia bacterium]
MDKAKRVLFCANVNFLKWRRNFNVILLFILWFVWSTEHIRPVAQYCQDNGYVISPWVLPFQISNVNTILVYVFTLIVLFANAPFCDFSSPFVMIRTGKAAWFRGQLLYIVGAGFVLTLFTYASALVTLAPCLGFSMNWGGVLIGLAEQPALMAGYDGHILPKLAIIQSYSGAEATLLAFLLLWGMAVLTGSILLFFNITFHPGAGVVAVASIEAFTIFTQYGPALGAGKGWLVAWDVLHWCSMHHIRPADVSAPVTPWMAIGLFFGIAGILGLCSARIFCGRDTVFESDEI